MKAKGERQGVSPPRIRSAYNQYSQCCPGKRDVLRTLFDVSCQKPLDRGKPGTWQSDREKRIRWSLTFFGQVSCSMSSVSLRHWRDERTKQLDEIEAAHTSVGGSPPGRRFATQQINHAYAMLLSSQFQGFCRDLHSESVDHFSDATFPVSIRNVVRDEFGFARKLDKGNPTPGNIGADFARLGAEFWRLVYADDRRNNTRRERLEELNRWRNAIAHQDFDPAVLGGTSTLHLSRVRAWRQACDGLAKSFDRVMLYHLDLITGHRPW